MTNIDELLKRLRERATQTEWSSFLKGSKRNLASEAADAISVLQSELAAVRQELEEAWKIREAAENLIKVKGRHHTEIAYQRLITALDAARKQTS